MRFTLSHAVAWTDGDLEVRLPAKQPVEATFLPMNSAEYRLRLLGGYMSSTTPSVIVTPRDFDFLEDKVRQHLVRVANEAGAFIVPVLETASELDEVIRTRLEQTVSTRRGAPERPD